MAKLINFLLLIVAIDICLVIFMGATTPSSSLLALVENPQNWNNLALISQISLIIAAAGTVGIFVGLFIGTKSDFLIMAPLIAIFLSYAASFWELYQRIVSIPQFDSANYLGIIIISPLLVAFIYTLLKFWRGND